MDEPLACVTTFPDRQQAELARGALEASGLEAMIMADDMGGTLPGLDFPQGVGVFVREADLAAAKEILGAGA
jgi:hypothetical protein